MINPLNSIALANYTTYKIGGPADCFVEVTNVSEMEEALSYTWNNNLPFRILGKGSNVLISDRGFRGLIIYNNTNAVEIHADEAEPTATLYVDSGAILNDLSKLTAQRGFQGLEWAIGIPGTIGGAILTNAGTNTGNIASCLDWIMVFSLTKGKKKKFANELELDYRTSIYRTDSKLLKKEAILSAQFRLKKGNIKELNDIIRRRIERRRKREPVEPNAGSIFKNPPGNKVRTLVAECGLSGLTIGGAQISEVAPSFIINKDNATAADVIGLISLIKEKILENYSITLQPEIEFIGEWDISLQKVIDFIR